MASLFASTGGGPGFNVYPQPTGGQGAFGKVPGQTGLPPSNYQQALTQIPGLNQNAATASSDVQSLLQGQLSPDTSDYIKRLVAAKGVSTGVEGSAFNTADLVKSLGLTSEQLMTSGLGAYNSLLNTVGQLQENPGLMSEISQQNAALAAAPDPTAVHNQMLQDLMNEFGMGNNPSGGTGGYGSVHTLGPKPTYGGGPGVGASPFAGGLSGNDIAQVGGPLSPSPGVAGGNAFNWNDYIQQMFGYQMGNPVGAAGTGAGFGTAAGAGDFDQSYGMPMDPYTNSYLNPTPGVSGGFDFGGDMAGATTA